MVGAEVSLRAYRFGTWVATWDLHWPRHSRHARPQSLTSLKGPLAPATLPADDQQPALAQALGGLFVSESQARWSPRGRMLIDPMNVAEKSLLLVDEPTKQEPALRR